MELSIGTNNNFEIKIKRMLHITYKLNQQSYQNHLQIVNKIHIPSRRSGTCPKQRDISSNSPRGRNAHRVSLSQTSCSRGTPHKRLPTWKAPLRSRAGTSPANPELHSASRTPRRACTARARSRKSTGSAPPASTSHSTSTQAPEGLR